jgi:hypothetical protein
MTLCEQYQAWAKQAVEEWDGLDTAELLWDICEKTGERLTDVTDRALSIFDPPDESLTTPTS